MSQQGWLDFAVSRVRHSLIVLKVPGGSGRGSAGFLFVDDLRFKGEGGVHPKARTRTSKADSHLQRPYQSDDQAYEQRAAVPPAQANRGLSQPPGNPSRRRSSPFVLGFLTQSLSDVPS